MDAHEDQASPLEERLDALEHRVRQLEERGAPSSGPEEGEALWALAGLRERVEEPGAVLMTGSVSLPDGRVAHWQQAALTRDLLEPDFTERAEVLTALAHPVRLRILQRLLTGAATVQELAGTEGLGTTGQIYHHLRQLVAAGWLRPLGGGRYEVPVQRVVPLLVTILGAGR